MREIFIKMFLAQTQQLLSQVARGMKTSSVYVDKALEKEDLVKMILLGCLQHIEEKDVEEKELGKLIGIKTKNVIDWYQRETLRSKKRASRRPTFSEETEAPNPCEKLIQKEETKRIVGESNSEIIGVLLRHADGETLHQIAGDMNILPNTLTQRIKRFRRELVIKINKGH